jgi:signal transduction histidine kinase
MAALLMRGDAANLSPKFLEAFDELTEKLREIVDDLRPPMLAFGLKLAFEDFADNLVERNQDSVEIQTDIRAKAECRYPDTVENNLYRIVQEACENSLRYAQAKKLLIFGRLSEKQIDIRVEDDGIGLDSDISLKLNDMLANKHFGLVGMFERANLIGAEISIHSQRNQGTRIQVLWKAKEAI